MSRPASPRGLRSGPRRAVAGVLALAVTAVFIGAFVVAAPAGASPSATTTTTIATSDPSPVVGEVVTYTATVGATEPGPASPTGTVTVTGTSGTLCSATLDEASPDTASCTTTYAAPVTDSVTASYAGDANDAGSASAPVAETVTAASTTTSLSNSTTSSVAGQYVTYTATVSAVAPSQETPGGDVVFSDGAGAFCTVGLSDTTPDQAACTTSYPTTGAVTVTATYTGTSDDTSSVSNQVTESVSAAQTTTSVNTSAEPTVTGQAVTFTATVAPVTPSAGVPSGQVLFTVMTSEDKSLACSAGDTQTLNNGTVTCTIPGTKLNPIVGPLSVSAGYEGTPAYQPSLVTVEQDIDEAATTVTATSRRNPSNPGQSVVITATVGVTSPGAGKPSGMVTFSFAPAGTLACVKGDEVALKPSGRAVKCTLSRRSVTSAVTVTVTYGGSNAYQPASRAVQQVVI